VVFGARSKQLLDRHVAEAAGTDRALAVALDVTSDRSVQEAVDTVLAAYGRVDLVVNNAGSGGTLARWVDTDSESFRAMFDVHVFGAERVTRAVAGPMRAQGGGCIVNVASAVAWVPMPGASAYCAAKAAVVSLSESLRAELGPAGIDMRVFAPPFTRTDPDRQWPLDRTRVFEREWVAEQLVRFLQGRKPCALAGGGESLLWLKRAAPGLAARIVQGIGLRALGRLTTPRLPP
jgi:NAD(P)-dependent dehydrogenase (short-subunit alcohol dehydrogenase family)